MIMEHVGGSNITPQILVIGRLEDQSQGMLTNKRRGEKEQRGSLALRVGWEAKSQQIQPLELKRSRKQIFTYRIQKDPAPDQTLTLGPGGLIIFNSKL